MTIDSDSIKEKLAKLKDQVDKLTDSVNCTSENTFIVKVAHTLTSNKLTDVEKLACIKLHYMQMARPKAVLSEEDKKLLGKVYDK